MKKTYSHSYEDSFYYKNHFIEIASDTESVDGSFAYDSDEEDEVELERFREGELYSLNIVIRNEEGNVVGSLGQCFFNSENLTREEFKKFIDDNFELEEN